MEQRSIIDLLKAQSRGDVDRIYGEASQSSSSGKWTCQAIFQSLSSFSKTLFMRVLYVENPFSIGDFTGYMLPAGEIAIRAVLEELESLYILIDADVEASKAMDIDELLDFEDGVRPLNLDRRVRINPVFQCNLRAALLHAEKPWEQDRLTKNDPSPPTLDEIDRNCTEKWNKMLGLIVGIIPSSAFQTNVIVPFVRRFKLMKEIKSPSSGQNELAITSKGYEFMLKDFANQVWDFVVESVTNGKPLVESLSFLFMLSYAEYGVGYPISSLVSSQKQLMFELSEVGLLFLRSKASPLYYPTKAAIKMVFGSQAVLETSSALLCSSSTASMMSLTSTATDPSNRLQIIVETNLQVIAYVSNELHLALLKLFVDVHVRLPNMAMGRITREKSKQAFRIGMKAAQIVDFLSSHAHPTVFKRTQRLPENVIDQLVLWEKEMKRMQMTDAVVMDCAELIGVTPELFSKLVQDLKFAKVLLWSDAGRLLVACKQEGISLLNQFKQENIYR